MCSGNQQKMTVVAPLVRWFFGQKSEIKFAKVNNKLRIQARVEMYFGNASNHRSCKKKSSLPLVTGMQHRHSTIFIICVLASVAALPLITQAVQATAGETASTSSEKITSADTAVDNTTATACTVGFDWYLGLKTAHERNNSYPFGPKNCSSLGVTPIISIGDFTFEADFYCGRQITYSGYLGNENHLRQLVQSHNFKHFHNAFLEHGISSVRDGVTAKLREGHFFRNYSRVIYTCHSGNFRVVFGDTISRNLIGFQQPLSGGGISIFRKKGNGEVINVSSAIIITKLSKIECRLGNDVICVRVLAPGVYSLEDLPEEAKIPGASIKISDQLNRSETLKIDYFGGKYDLLTAGEDDFDFSVVFSHRWDVDDPHRMRYAAKPRCSITYRYGITDDLLCGMGAQYYDGSFTADCSVVYETSLGTFAPNIALSSGDAADSLSERTHCTVAGGMWYALPKNSTGVSFEIFIGALGNGFGDLGKTRELENTNNEVIRRYGGLEGSLNAFINEHRNESIRQCTARLYAKPIFGITPTLVFNGLWTKSCRLREYTLSLSTTICDATVTATAGLTYDDPHGGRNARSPDKRVTAACSIPLDKEVCIDGSYYHHDEDRLRNYTSIKYLPKNIPGLEISVERYTKPGLNNPVASVKYDNEYVSIKAEENIKDNYADPSNGNRTSHGNQQRFFFGTSISSDGIGAPRKSSLNGLRSAKKEANAKKKNKTGS
jgi:hypothetical protein